jgi:signal transduction histidine kinase
MDPKANAFDFNAFDFNALATVTAAHNLQHLLAIMVTCVDAIVSRTPGPARAHPDFHDLDAAIDRAFQLSRDLISAIGLQHTPDPVVLDLNLLLTRYRGTLQRLLPDDMHLEVTTSEETLLVAARPVQLEWVLLNLVANGRDAMAGGELHVETAAFEYPTGAVDGGPATACVRLTVRDEGHGVTHAEPAQLFEPFFSTRPLGTGLGLTSVAIAVRELGGWLYIDGDPGGGAVVHVLLPRYGRRAQPRNS